MIQTIKNFIEKWGGVICTAILIIFCIFAVVCACYAIVENPFIGICGLIGSLTPTAIFVYCLVLMVKDVRKVKGGD